MSNLALWWAVLHNPGYLTEAGTFGIFIGSALAFRPGRG